MVKNIRKLNYHTPWEYNPNIYPSSSRPPLPLDVTDLKHLSRGLNSNAGGLESLEEVVISQEILRLVRGEGYLAWSTIWREAEGLGSPWKVYQGYVRPGWPEGLMKNWIVTRRMRYDKHALSLDSHVWLFTVRELQLVFHKNFQCLTRPTERWVELPVED